LAQHPFRSDVTETDERLKDLNRYPDAFKYDAQDAAVERAEKDMLAGWEPYGLAEHSARSVVQAESAPNVDVQV
jgi:hypothetical protein